MRSTGNLFVVLLFTLLLGGCASMAMSKGAAPAPAKRMDIGDGFATEDADGDDFRFARAESEGGELAGAEPDGPAPPPAPPPGAKPPTTSDAGGGAGQAHQVAEPLLIYEAVLHLAIFEAPKTIDAVHELAKKMGGYLVRRADRAIIVRVPSKRFYEALKAIGTLGDVLHREESVRDVTEQFFDLETRLRNARATRARLEKLLDQAKDVKEVLLVEKELARVTETIERMEGKLKRMRELIAFSTITVRLEPRPVDKMSSSVRLPFPWLNQLGLSDLMSF